MAGLHILKYAEDLSDDEVCARWLETRIINTSAARNFSVTLFHWIGPDPLASAHGRRPVECFASGKLGRGGEGWPRSRSILPAPLSHGGGEGRRLPDRRQADPQARERLVKQAKRAGIDLRQSYTRVGKRTLIQHQRYAHAKQFKRANRQLRKLKTFLGRTIRDIGRKINGDAALEAAFLRPLWLGERVMTQKKRDPLPKIYALHAPEVECIGKGKAHKPYEFGVKVSVATTLNRCKGGQFAIHAKALPGRPYDGHTLETVIPEIEDLTGATLKRILADAGYRGHNAPGVYKLRVFTAGQKRRVTPAIKRR